MRAVQWRVGNQTVAAGAYAVDLDGDGASELITTSLHAVYVYQHQEWLSRNCTLQISFLGDSLGNAPPSILDVDGDGQQEILLPLLRDGCTFVRAYSSRGNVEWEAEPVREFKRTLGSREPGLHVWAVLGTGGGRQLLCTVDTGLRGTPRGILALDLVAKHPVWKVAIASIPIRVVVADLLPGLAGEEILIGTYASANGAQVGATDDFRSALLLLDAHGRLVWQQVIGEASSAVVPYAEDLDGDSRPELLACKYAGSADGSSELLEVNPETGTIVRRTDIDRGRVAGCEVIDLEPEGKRSLVAATSSGRLVAYNRELQEIRRVTFDGSAAVELRVAELFGDDRPEVLCSSAGVLRILDHRWHVVAKGSIPGGTLILQADTRGRHRVFCTTGPQQPLALVEVVPLPLPIRPFLLGVLSVVAASAVGVFSVRLLRRRRASQQEDLWDALHLEMREFGHSTDARIALGDLERALREGESPLAPACALRQTNEKAVAPAAAFATGAAGRLRRVQRLARRLGLRRDSRPALWQDSSRDCLMRIEKLARGALPAAELRGLASEVAHLDEEISWLRRAVRGHYAADVLQEIHAALRQVLSPKTRSASLDPSVSIELQTEGLVWVHVRGEVLRTVLAHLIGNALDAMASSAERRLCFEIHANPLKTRILVRDTGCGIPPEMRARVFEPGFTTKGEGHGQGLSLCAEWLRPFGGRVQVRESVGGLGTSLEIVLETVTPATHEEPSSRARTGGDEQRD